MSDDENMSPERLDPATLRWVGRWHEEERRRASEYALHAFDPTLSRAVAVAHEQSRNAFGRLAAKAAGQAPSLSDWIVAAERTRLGKPRWDTSSESDGQPHTLPILRLWWDTANTRVDIVGPGEVIHLGRWTQVDWEWQEVSTPAELRDALDHMISHVTDDPP